MNYDDGWVDGWCLHHSKIIVTAKWHDGNLARMYNDLRQDDANAVCHYGSMTTAV